MHIIEHGFTRFSDEEIKAGLAYAAQKDLVTLDYGRLRKLSDNAGKTRINEGGKLTPRDVAFRAIRSFEREYPGSKIPPKQAEGYVHAIAKMLAERSPNTQRKRRRDAEAEDMRNASYGIEDTPEIDPEVNRQLSLNLTGSMFEK